MEAWRQKERQKETKKEGTVERMKEQKKEIEKGTQRKQEETVTAGIVGLSHAQGMQAEVWLRAELYN